LAQGSGARTTYGPQTTRRIEPFLHLLRPARIVGMVAAWKAQCIVFLAMLVGFTPSTRALVFQHNASKAATLAPAGAAAYYPFSGNANDAIGTNDGVVDGPTLTTDRDGTANAAYAFPASKASIEFASSQITSTSSFTFCLWLRINWQSGGASWGCVYSHPNHNPGFWLGIQKSDNTVRIHFGSGGSNRFDFSNKPTSDQWHHLCLAGDKPAAQMKLYIDGVAGSTWSMGNYFDDSGVPASSGQLGWYRYDQRFNGDMDEVYFYNTVLSESEIASVATGVGAAAVGDPHLQNAHGERFDLRKPGKHVLMNIPRGVSAAKCLLRVVADAQQLGGQCADMYFQELNVTGSWAEAKHAGGYHYSVSQRDGKASEWVAFGKVHLKVVHGRTNKDLPYLNVYAKHLEHAGYAIGGLLGEDDHEDACTPTVQCVKQISLFRPKDRRPSVASLAASSFE